MKNLTRTAILITEGHHCLLAMSKGDMENMRTETEGCVLDIHFGGETFFDLRYLTVVEKSVNALLV
jgi:hypothetical protein